MIANIDDDKVYCLMKILIFLPNHSLAIERGNSTHIKELVSNLSKLAEVTLVKADDDSITENVSLTRKIVRTLKGLFRGSTSIIINRPDLMYTRSGQAVFALILAKIFRVPIVIEVNGLSIEELNMAKGISHISRRISYFKSFLDDRSFKYANHLVVVSPKIKTILEVDYNIDPLKITVIENGANTELFKPIDTTEAKKELKLDPTSTYICFVGALYNWQGVEYLVRASRNIVEKCPQSYFLVVGDGPELESLINLASQNGMADRFMFTGSKPYQSIPLYINASDLCVAPFIKQRNLKAGFSAIKLYEYLACGKPVVASDIDEVVKLVEESRSGVCVSSEDSVQLADEVIRLINDSETRKQMGENGRAYAIENGSWENVARKVFKVCQTIKVVS